MEIKDFDNESDALIFRGTNRNEGHAASLFTYGKDKYRVKVRQCSSKEEQQEHQRWLSNQAWTVSKDIEVLTKVKELISSPDFGDNLEDVVFVAKKLEEEHWFSTTNAVIAFFDCPTDNIEKIKEMIDESLEEYNEQWNYKGN